MFLLLLLLPKSVVNCVALKSAVADNAIAAAITAAAAAAAVTPLRSLM